MKTIYNLGLVAVAGMLTFSSCSDDFLQKDSLTSVSTSTFWTTESDATEGLAACYDGLQSKYLYNGDTYSGGPLNMDCMTDNGGHFNWSGWMAGYDICNGIHTSSSWLVSDFWKASYEEIKRCNTLIDNIDRVSMDANTVATYKAEAKVLRALIYLNLTMTYNDVPFLTHVQSLTDAESEKSDRATIVEAIMQDLKDAADVLPTTASARGRITKGAALSILGRTALYNQKWADAISAYKSVMNLGYALYPDYAGLFTEENEGCSEIIFSVRYEGPGKEEGSAIGGHWDTPLEAVNGTLDLADAFYTTAGTPTTDTKICEKKADGSPDLWNVNTARYDNRDPRLKATLFVPGMAWKNNTNLYGGAAASYSTIYVMKYFNPNLNWSSSWDSGQDFYISRYAEVLLSLAEALVENGSYNYSEVTGLVNQVRARAGMPSVEDVEGSSLSQEELRQVIRHERRVETAFEGLRLFDLYRWKELKNAADRINKEASDNGFLYEMRNFRGEQEYVWPLPQSELDANPKLVQSSLWK